MTQTKTLTSHYVFWLARYAHNKLQPLFNELREIEPSIYTEIGLRFPTSDSVYPGLNGIQVSVHWKREGMFLHSSSLRSADEIDALAVEVKADIEKLKLEALAVA